MTNDPLSTITIPKSGRVSPSREPDGELTPASIQWNTSLDASVQPTSRSLTPTGPATAP
jgi:hypothetical protein